jgi:hypothetical protein
VLANHIMNEFHDEDGFADSRAAKQAGFAATLERGQEVDGLDAGLEDL